MTRTADGGSYSSEQLAAAEKWRLENAELIAESERHVSEHPEAWQAVKAANPGPEREMAWLRFSKLAWGSR